MKKKKGTSQAYQEELFVKQQQKLYDWKPVYEARKGMQMVTANELVKILNVKQDENYYYLEYTDPTTGKRVEQTYNHTDYIYTKL
jgi:hypothetical protein